MGWQQFLRPAALINFAPVLRFVFFKRVLNRGLSVKIESGQIADTAVSAVPPTRPVLKLLSSLSA